MLDYDSVYTPGRTLVSWSSQYHAHAKIIQLQLANRLPAATYAAMYSS